MITESGGTNPRRPKPPRPNNRTPLTSALPTRRERQTPVILPKRQVIIPRLYTDNTAAQAAVGQKRSVQPPITPITPTTLLSRTDGKRSRPSVNFYRGLSDVIMPLTGFDPSTISSNYGPRTHPITGRHSNHTGIDFAKPEGTPVLAAANGIVMGAISGDSVYGNQVVLGHGRNKNTMYGHMAKFVVKEGQKVRAGDVIGYVGSTGLSTGPHLHWETWVNNRPVNPMVFLGGS